MVIRSPGFVIDPRGAHAIGDVRAHEAIIDPAIVESVIGGVRRACDAAGDIIPGPHPGIDETVGMRHPAVNRIDLSAEEVIFSLVGL